MRGIFLNSPSRLGIIADIGANADFARSAIQKCDYEALLAAIRNSWTLNQRLDAGTNPPEVQQILDRVRDYLGAAKLLGAGGGGYLLLFGKDETAAAKIKQLLTSDPPNARARFVDFSLSQTGLQMTGAERGGSLRVGTEVGRPRSNAPPALDTTHHSGKLYPGDEL